MENNNIMDEKEKLMLTHYKMVLENRTFDEYDVFGFILFIRDHLEKSKFKNIRDFGDMFAHRTRDRGPVMTSISNAIFNNYQCEHKTNALKGYTGIEYDDWEMEWLALGLEFNISFTEVIIKEITLCVFSISQFVQHKHNENFGKFMLFQSNDNKLMLTTTEGRNDSVFVRFFTCGPFAFLYLYPVGRIDEPVETERIDGALRLKAVNKFII